MAFGFIAKSINNITQWITAGLFGGYAAPNMLKWYWWRFNGNGYFWGMISGTATALVFPVVLPSLSVLYCFPFILLISAGASVIASLVTEPEDDDVLKTFYRRVRPWGFWKPIHDKVIEETPTFKKNNTFKRDMTNVSIGIVWQMMLVLVPVYLIIQEMWALGISILVLVITSFILKKNWYDKLEEN